MYLNLKTSPVKVFYIDVNKTLSFIYFNNRKFLPKRIQKQKLGPLKFNKCN